MLKLFNSLSKKVEEFKPIAEGKVKMYVCGPTVYDKAHLGHARCYITWDILYRYLKFLGYNVTYCRNVTDVDDKILKKADEAGVSPDEIAETYYKSFTESMTALNCLKPDVEPRATKTIGEMISINKKLIEKGHAYVSGGDVYFDVKSFKDYGKLSHQPIDDLMAGARVEAGDKKKSPLDFALWKEDLKHGYNSPWSKGRPGWHIECSAMSRKYLGEQIDIHAGGADLIFPHHENEIAQSECANGCNFVNYFLHNGFVTINKEKMSKSLGNFLTADDLLQKFDSNTIRFFIITNHYRMPVEFSEEALVSAQAGVKRIIKMGVEGVLRDEDSIKEFTEAMNDDLNTSRALAVLFALTDKIKQAENKAVYENTLFHLASVLGFNFDLREKEEITEDALKELILPLYEKYGAENSAPARALLDDIIKIRTEARANKDWAKSDEIRDELAACKISLKDSKEGTTWEVN